MKPGDKVWYFNSGTQKIANDVVTDVFKGETLIGIETRTSFLLLGIDGFPTREALCEHYRKIFE